LPRNEKKCGEIAIFSFLSPVRLPFRHTGPRIAGSTLTKVINGRKQPIWAKAEPVWKNPMMA
jgi:hypothetical protein